MRGLGERDGFTLVELLVALAIFSLVSVAVVSVYGSMSRSCTTEQGRASAQQSARTGIDFISRDIRMAGLDPLQTAGAGLISFSATAIVFSLDRDASGTIETGRMETLSFLYNARNKTLDQVLDPETLSQQTFPLVDNLTGFYLTYLDAGGEETLELEAIRSVNIEISVQERAGGGRVVERTYVALVGCRNLGV